MLATLCAYGSSGSSGASSGRAGGLTAGEGGHAVGDRGRRGRSCWLPSIRDAAIKRFEFTFEMAWKAIQAQARREALDCLSPRDCFRTAFRLGLVENDERWMRMVEDRNRTSHAYNEKTAQEVYGALSAYSNLFRDLLARLRASQN